MVLYSRILRILLREHVNKKEVVRKIGRKRTLLPKLRKRLMDFWHIL